MLFGGEAAIASGKFIGFFCAGVYSLPLLGAWFLNDTLTSRFLAPLMEQSKP